jgi:uncharacterized protein YgiM (DUF1202 family)
MQKLLVLLALIAISYFSFGQYSTDFSYPGSYTTVSKTCGSCSKPVSSDSRVGMRCPHCGVRWGYENSTRSTSVRTVSRNIPTSGYATTATTANVRSGPSTDYGVVSTLTPNTLVTITGKVGNWVKVTFTDYLSYYGNVEQTGYIRADLLDF